MPLLRRLDRCRGLGRRGGPERCGIEDVAVRAGGCDPAVGSTPFTWIHFVGWQHNRIPASHLGDKPADQRTVVDDVTGGPVRTVTRTLPVVIGHTFDERVKGVDAVDIVAGGVAHRAPLP